MSKHSAPSAFDAASPAGADHLPPLPAPDTQATETQGQHPVPAVRAATRVDGWTQERQVAFLEALATTHNVTKAARAAGMSRTSAHRLRARLMGKPFDFAWYAALQCASDRLAHVATERALNGVEVPHYYRGELVGTSRQYDERLTVALLASRDDFLLDRPPVSHPAGAFESGDFTGLLARVAEGPGEWE